MRGVRDSWIPLAERADPFEREERVPWASSEGALIFARRFIMRLRPKKRKNARSEGWLAC